MNPAPPSFFRSHLAIEWGFALLILMSVGHVIWYLFTYYHLPPPFFYEPSDIYADWFNTGFWARDGGAYDVWTTLYPPLSFVLLRIVSIDSCYPTIRAYDASPGHAIRECDWVGVTAIWGLWLLSVVLIYIALRKFDRRTAIPRTICAGFGWPILNGIERGNLILIAVPFFLLAVMPILKSARARWIFAALSINMKVYLIAPFMAQLLLRRWRWVECVILATLIIYLISFALLGTGTPAELAKNLFAWSDLTYTNPLDFWPATTYRALYSLMESEAITFPAILILGSRNAELVQLMIQSLLYFTQGLLLVAFLATWLRPEAVTRYRMYLLGTLFALITSEGGGYTPALYMALIMIEPWKGPGRIISIVLCYMLAISYDYTFDVIAEVQRESYLTNRQVTIQMGLTVWPFLRPLVIQIIAISMACVTIREVWHDVRLQGWARRWRFRHDAPMLPFVRRPSPPVET
jgi:hypothetical protein